MLLVAVSRLQGNMDLLIGGDDLQTWMSVNVCMRMMRVRIMMMSGGVLFGRLRFLSNAALFNVNVRHMMVVDVVVMMRRGSS